MRRRTKQNFRPKIWPYVPAKNGRYDTLPRHAAIVEHERPCENEDQKARTADPMNLIAIRDMNLTLAGILKEHGSKPNGECDNVNINRQEVEYFHWNISSARPSMSEGGLMPKCI